MTVQYKFMIPVALRKSLEELAAQSRRSLSAEVIKRLEESVAADSGASGECDALLAENERLREALLKVEIYHREKYEKSKAEAAKYKSDEITDGSVEACLSDALLHLEASKYVGGLIAADRAALERKEGGT